MIALTQIKIFLGQYFWDIFRSVQVKIRSSRPEVFYKEGVLRNFAKVTEKHLCQSLFFNKVTGLWLPPVAASENFW